MDVGTDPATGKRRQVRRRFKTVDEAVAEYAKLKGEVRTGTYVGQSSLTVAQACENWLAGRRGIRAKTASCYHDALRPVITTYGAVAVQRLTKKDIDDLIPLLVAGKLPRSNGKPRRPWKARTVNLMLFVLGSVLDDLVRQGELARNVVALVDRLPQVKQEMQTYSPAEVKKVLTAARPDRLEPAWLLALSGLRRGEICGMRWADVDLKRRTITIRENNVVVDGLPMKSEPKSERSKRTLPLTDALVEVLKRAKRRQAAERRRAGDAYRDTGYLVVNELGEQLHPETVADKWDTLVKRASVRRIRLHDARHTCGTLMHLQGVPVAVIAAWLGHADPAFTMRTYVHSQDHALHDAARVLGHVTSA
ncbi:tyrosine-type recombinase/integrase [Planosporangium mesophilum]|uniref:tyrosine-type recombinase/integrase n=1 Tax=Planosporangium mesophilum TaxID=689768 RepID=UPI0019520CCE|nr:site-specific integrase [Planosporangium mesophilum]